jgi:peptidyl-prolyl cis-trans isomerase B (cyclophilin B)
MFRKNSLPLFLCILVFSACSEESGNSEPDDRSENNRPGRPLSTVPASQRLNYYKELPPRVIDENKTYNATIKTEAGNIVVELDAYYAPMHVNNFVFLAQQGFYDGLTFHRVEPGFVIQGGDPLATGKGGPGYTLEPEFGLPHTSGAFAAARLPDELNPEMRSSGSQFYITQEAQHQLDGKYTVYGRVIKGFEYIFNQKPGNRIIKVDIEESDG